MIIIMIIINKIDLVDELKKIKNEYIYYIKNLFSDALLEDPFSICSLKLEFPKKIIDILNNTYSTKLKFFKDKYKFKINLVQNAEFLSQEFLFSFYDVKKKLISEFNGTEVKEDTSVKEKPELKEKAEN